MAQIVIAATVQVAGLAVVKAYTALDKAEGTVRESNLAFLNECVKEGVLKKDVLAALRMVGATEPITNRFKVWMSENSVAADTEGKLVHVKDEAGNVHVTYKPKAQVAKEREARTPAAPAAGTPAASKPAAEPSKPVSKADRIAEAERGLRIVTEMMRGIAVPKDCKTVDQVVTWVLANLSKHAA